MGKIVGKKKKGRPSLLDLQKRSLKEQEQQRNQNQENSQRNVSAPQITPNYDSATATPLRRSSRRNPNHSPEDNDEEDDEEEGEEELARTKRREKKLKLVLKLPSSQEKSPVDSESRGSDSNLKESNAGSSHKKRKIDSIGDGSGIADSKMVAKFEEEKSVSGANPTSNSQGGQLDSGPSTALPDKKLLLFILDRLQKKDTYGVFSEPVDPKELPDYNEVIEHPMDFGTIRKKLASGTYANLEQFEKDVFLISSNAMQYNAPDTIYFRQARSIQELAKKNFENLRQDSNDNEAEPKVIRRGRPPTKNFKKPPGRPSLERAASEFSSDATLATGAENTIWSNHDTRKGPLTSDKSSFADSSGKFYGNDVYSGWFTDNKSDRSEEGSMLKGYMMKQGKRHFVLDENRRNTYKLFHPSGAAHETSVLATFDGEKKQLVAVGAYLEHGYTRSLARFAANLGPVAWKIATKKIERSLPAGVQFGPGWVGENDVPSHRPLLLLPSLSLPPGLQTSSQPCSVHQVPCSSSASYSLETREDKHFDKPEASNLSEKHVPPVHPISVGHLSKPIAAFVTSSSSLLATTRSPEPRDEKREAIEGSSRTGFNITNSSAGAVKPRPPSQIHQSHVIHPGMNGYNGAYGSNLPAQTAKIIRAARSSGFSFQSSQMLDAVSKTATNFVRPATASSDSGDPRFSENTCTNNPSCPLPNLGSETVAAPRSGLHAQPSRPGLSSYQKPNSKLSSLQKADSRLSPQQKPGSVPPDLNVRFHSPGSPSSSQVDSAQPDLALQL